MAQKNSNGFIENDSGEILSLRENEISGNMEIVWEPEDENAQKREDQKWLQRKSGKNHHTLKHVISKKYLTVTSTGFLEKGELTVKGM